MSDSFRPDRAVRYACAVLADLQIGRLPVDPFRLAADVGISLVPLSAIRDNPNWIPYNMPAALQMTRAVTLSYPTFVVDVIRFNRPRQARASLFGLDRPAWIHRLDAIDRDRASVDEDMANTMLFLFRDYLLARRCTACGRTFSDEAQTDRCPFCGAEGADWVL